MPSVQIDLLLYSTSLHTITNFKGGYLDFSHLTELKNISITDIYCKKQYKSSIT